MTDQIVALGGRLDYWEDSTAFTGVCLTFEFDDKAQADVAVDALRQQGERIFHEPRDYGD